MSEGGNASMVSERPMRRAKLRRCRGSRSSPPLAAVHLCANRLRAS